MEPLTASIICVILMIALLILGLPIPYALGFSSMLIGLVTKNAILLIDYANNLRKKGETRDAAVKKAGPITDPALLKYLIYCFEVLGFSLLLSSLIPFFPDLG